MTLARFRRPFRTATLCLALLAIAAVARSQTPAGRDTSAASVAQYALSQQMPMDPEALVGTLPNGLKYYIRANPRPAQRAELRLVVKAGSVLEDDDQRGLAHFVEHMEFEGTTHFPRQTIVDFLASLGLGIGPDANAATSYDDTQYTLRVPTDVPNVLDRALTVLQDWAQGATFDQDGIDRERGIVLAEWRMHLGAAERTQDKILKAQLQGSRYADRSPIGDPTVIEHAQREQLVRYYHDWYRPDLMAVVVVGDIDRDAVAALIRDHFSSLVSPSPRRPRPIFDVPEQPDTRYAIVTDKETTATAVELSDLRPARNQGTVGGYRDIMLDELFSSMLGDRLDEIAQGPTPPFVRAAVSRSLFPFPRTRDQALMEAIVANDGVTRGLEALVTELHRVAQFGFTATELARAKQAMMAGSERVVTESPDRESASRADEYTRNFLEDEALPTIWQELAFHRRFVPDITLQEVNALTHDWFPDDNRLVVVSAPEAAGVVLPTSAQLAAAVTAANAKRVTAYVDTLAGEKLMDAAPARGSIVKTTERAAGITEWTLSNGATVVLKPTTLRADQVLFRASAPGGTSLASDADFPAARVADTIVPAGGVGRFNSVTLDKLLSSKAVNVTPFISEIEEGMGGGSTPQDLETMFQLLYLRFTQPRADPTAFAAVQSQARALLANREASPDFVFNRTIDAALSGDSARRQPESPATVEHWDLAKSLAFYKARFADASNFTFVFVGSFTVDGIKPLVETYLASLPATRAHETYRDLGITLPPGVVEKTVEKGIAPKSQVAIVFDGPFVYDDTNRMALETMTLVLESRLFDTIRQELGGTYSITATPDIDRVPKPQYAVRIEWTCDPQQTASLVQRVFDEIAFVKKTPLSPGQMARLRDSLVRDYQRNSADNRYFLNEIARRYRDGDAANVGAVEQEPARIAALTADMIHDAADVYLNMERYVKVVLMPQKP
ncbi:MAG TPA: insulinase family protein [Vicinamibacterales bacterium]|nr:insulinase family protein [Vicinamibacterales bacterium]